MLANNFKRFQQLIEDFYQGNVTIQSMNSSFITLIRKKDSPSNAADFRPISLLNCSLKIIAKLIANSLQTVMHKLVHINQYGFLEEKSIQDCLPWVYEYIHHCNQSNMECLILKLDFENAFDMLEHKTKEILIAKVLGENGFV